MIYRIVFKLVLERIPPETAHSAAAKLMAWLGHVPGARALLRRLLGTPDPSLEINALGLTFPSPLGVAAGLDKNLTWFEELGSLGFGFVEVGTVTARAQPGNPRPRVHRLSAARALVNSMGFPNEGAAAAARRLRARTGRTIVAVNVGRSKAASDAAADYRETIAQLAPLADFLVLNVSSPNTPGLRDLQAIDALGTLIAAVRDELARTGRQVPLLVKVSPDLSDEQLDAIAELALELHLDGIVAVNTTTSRDGLSSRPGGVSGAPLKPRSLHVLRRLRAATGGQLVLVSVGGVQTADDVWGRIVAGATLVEAYTGFVYGGPMWPHKVNRELARRLRETGVRSIGEVVGAQSSAPTPAGSARGSSSRAARWAVPR